MTDVEKKQGPAPTIAWSYGALCPHPKRKKGRKKKEDKGRKREKKGKGNGKKIGRAHV